MVTEAIEKEKENEERNQYLKDLISGKTLIEWNITSALLALIELIKVGLQYFNYSCYLNRFIAPKALANIIKDIKLNVASSNGS